MPFVCVCGAVGIRPVIVVFPSHNRLFFTCMSRYFLIKLITFTDIRDGLKFDGVVQKKNENKY